ncbi:hypothetical protein RF11_08939 [Thelohanellus kitauei]|uniref:Uncharacterized protein n=1 Tax=Thelohanellus kitauei TaxID=669202 RepID=A0A0C2IBQ3_THEKT|nr:hypothetical protein RF11_08939 [Thelohanellus kitauei]
MCCTGNIRDKTLSCQPCESKDTTTRNGKRSCICPKGTIDVPQKTENEAISGVGNNERDFISDYLTSLHILEKAETPETFDSSDTESSESLDLKNVFQDYGTCHRKPNSNEIICPKHETE